MKPARAVSSALLLGAVLASLFGAISASAQMIPGGATGVLGSRQGGPFYTNARTDLTFAPIPAPLPSVGGSTGAGTCITQPGYNNLVCRVTDITTENSSGMAQQQDFDTCCGGWADLPAWNSDSTMFFIQNNGSGVILVYLNDSGATPAFTPLYSGSSLDSGLIASAQWSRANPNLFYTVGDGAGCGASTQLVEWTVNPPNAPVCGGTVFDLATLANCAPMTGNKLMEYFVDQSGQNFYFLAGPAAQGTGYLVGEVNLSNGCRWMNTLTQQIGGNWGPTGQAAQGDTMSITATVADGTNATYTTSASDVTAGPYRINVNDLVTVTGTTNCGGALNVAQATVTAVSGSTFSVASTETCSSASDSGSAVHNYYIHGLRGSLDGTVEMLGPSGTEQNRHFWLMNSLNVNVDNTGQFGTSFNNGHFTSAYSHFIFNGAHTADSQWCKLGKFSVLFASPSSPWSALIPTQAYCGTGTYTSGDDHPSSSNDISSEDNYPVFTSTIYEPYGGTPSYAWQNEILASSQANLGTTWRFGASYSTGNSSFFDCQNDIGTVSPNGKWFLFTSDWGNTLGTDANGKNRCDVFAMKLQ